MKDNVDIKKNLNNLRTRANKRNVSLSSNKKSVCDTKVENDFFKMMENQIYNQIARS